MFVVIIVFIIVQLVKNNNKKYGQNKNWENSQTYCNGYLSSKGGHLTRVGTGLDYFRQTIYFSFYLKPKVIIIITFLSKKSVTDDNNWALVLIFTMLKYTKSIGNTPYTLFVRSCKQIKHKNAKNDRELTFHQCYS